MNTPVPDDTVHSFWNGVYQAIYGYKRKIEKSIHYTNFKLLKRFTSYFVIPCLLSKLAINHSKNVFGLRGGSLITVVFTRAQ